jgi:hypothetical protein
MNLEDSESRVLHNNITLSFSLKYEYNYYYMYLHKLLHFIPITNNLIM